jgi:hypothetical protein
MVTKGLFFQFCDIEKFAQISKKQKKRSKNSNFTLEKTTFFQKISQLWVQKLTKIAPKTH